MRITLLPGVFLGADDGLEHPQVASKENCYLQLHIICTARLSVEPHIPHSMGVANNINYNRSVCLPCIHTKEWLLNQMLWVK